MTDDVDLEGLLRDTVSDLFGENLDSRSLQDYAYEVVPDRRRELVEMVADETIENIEHAVETLREEMNEHEPVCPKCGGSGGAPSENTCPACGGSGRP